MTSNARNEIERLLVSARRNESEAKTRYLRENGPLADWRFWVGLVHGLESALRAVKAGDR